MRVLHLEKRRYDAGSLQRLEAAAQVDYFESDSRTELLSVVQSAPFEAIFVRLGVDVDAELMRLAPSLKWLVTPTTGLDHIDRAEMKNRGVQLISLKGELDLLENVHSTAEHTWALLLALIRKLPAAHVDVCAGNWRRGPFLGAELHGKRLGVLGCGRLGRKVAGFGVAFGMDVFATDTDPGAFRAADKKVSSCSLEELLAHSDILSLHLPLNDQTSGFLSEDRIKGMRPGALLINTARGELVDETALLEALCSGHLAGAALDVLSGDSRWGEEGASFEHPLASYAKEHTNLVLTPHIGGYGRDSIAMTRSFVVDRFLSATAGGGQ